MINKDYDKLQEKWNTLVQRMVVVKKEVDANKDFKITMLSKFEAKEREYTGLVTQEKELRDQMFNIAKDEYAKPQ
jgi:hypothetical protein